MTARSATSSTVRSPFSPRRLVLFAALAVVSHGAILMNGFVWDDETLIADHPRMGMSGFHREIFRRDYGLEFGMRTPTGYYRPLFVSLAHLQRSVFGLRPTGYRLVSLATLAAAGWMIAAVLQRYTRRRGAATLAGALFVCHPFKTESVVFVAAWPDLAMALWMAGAIWAGLSVKRTNSAARRAALAASFAALALGAALTKESGYFASAALMTGFLAMGRGKRRWAMALGLAGAAGLAAALGLRAWADVSGPEGQGSLRILLSPASRDGAASSLWAAATTLSLWIVPRESRYLRFNPLAPGEGPPPVWAPAAQVLIIALAILCLGALVWLIWRRRPLLAMLWGWLLAGSFPLFLAVGLDMPYSERYVAAAPLAMLSSLGLCRRVPALRRFPSPTTPGGSLSRVVVLAWAVLALCAVFSLRGSARALTPRSFWTTIVEDDSRLFYGHLGLSNVYLSDGDFEGARREALVAISQRPDWPMTRHLAANLGLAAIAEGNPAEALRWYGWTLERLPRNEEALKGRAVALHLLGRHREARAAIEHACAETSHCAPIHHVAARIYVQSPDITPAEALARVREAAALAPGIPTEWTTLQGIEAARGKSDGGGLSQEPQSARPVRAPESSFPSARLPQ